MRYKQLAQKLRSYKLIAVVVLLLAMGIGYKGARLYADRSSKASTCTDTCVYINRDGFSQTELAIAVGNYVEFRSADGESHNLALGEGSEHSDDEHIDTHNDHELTEHAHDHVAGTESGVFKADEAWKVQFKQPGTYVIHDHLHPELSILVVAYEPSK